MLRCTRNRSFSGTGLALALLLQSVSLVAHDAAVRVQVTDPGELAAMGFGPGAIVYRAGDGSSAEPETPDEYGTTVSGYSAYNATQFHGRVSTYSYSCSLCGGEAYYTGGDNFAAVQLEMPSGSSFKSVRWWGIDNHASDLKFFALKTCLPAFGAGSPESTLLESATSAGTPGNASGSMIIPGTETVDNEACTYFIRVRWDASSDMLRLHKVRAMWERQVSPAPAVASFNDVPTDHPFFQFIEALSASAITAGCSAAPPLYCPDAPLTRGQMAVFLSKALGLHWP